MKKSSSVSLRMILFKQGPYTLGPCFLLKIVATAPSVLSCAWHLFALLVLPVLSSPVQRLAEVERQEQVILQSRPNQHHRWVLQQWGNCETTESHCFWAAARGGHQKKNFYFTRNLRKQGHVRVFRDGIDILKWWWLEKGWNLTVASGTPAYNCKTENDVHKRNVADRGKVHLTYAPVWDSNP